MQRTLVNTALACAAAAMFALAGCGSSSSSSGSSGSSSSSSSASGSSGGAVAARNPIAKVAFSSAAYLGVCEKDMETPNTHGNALTPSQAKTFCGCVQQQAQAKGLSSQSETSISDADFKTLYVTCENQLSGSGGTSGSSSTGGTSGSSGSGGSSGAAASGSSGSSSSSGGASPSGASGSST